MRRYPKLTEQEFMAVLKKYTANGTGSTGKTYSMAVSNQSLGRPEPSGPERSAPSPYKSKWEASYAGKLELEQRAGIITRWWYEPFSLWLPGKVRYKPDFLVEYQQDMEDVVCHMPLNIVEVKGWSKNKRDGMTRLKIAAALFPCFRWVLASHTKNGWEEVAL